MQTTIRGLVSGGELARDAGEDLNKRLDEAAERLSDGETDKAHEKLVEFSQQLINLRKEGKISDRTYQSLVVQLSLLDQTLRR